MRRTRAQNFRRWAAWALVLGLALEVVGQAVALATWCFGEREVGGAQPTILCVGDSYTYGLGADPEKTYPRQLQRALAERGKPSIVVQGAWPGRDSREVLLELPAQLRRFAPQLVYVLVGHNDPRRRPERTARPELGSTVLPFEWRWRTWDLAVRVVRWVSAQGVARTPLTFLGQWHRGEYDIWFEADGRVRAGNFELRWLQREDQLLLVLPDGKETRLEWRLEGDELWLGGGLLPDGSRVARGPSPLAAARRALYESRFAEAIAGFRSCAVDPEVAALAHEGLVVALTKDGAPQAAAASLGWLEQRLADVRRQGLDDQQAAESLAFARLTVGDHRRALALAGEVVVRHPESQRGWEVLLKSGGSAEHRPAVLAIVDGVKNTLTQGRPELPHLLHFRGTLLQATDPAAALSSHLEAVLAGGDENFAQEQIAGGGAAFDGALFERCLAALAVTPEQSERLRRVFTGATLGSEAVSQVLAEHLVSIVALCRQANAEPVLLTYPRSDPLYEAAVQRAMAEVDVGVVPVAAILERESAAQPAGALFVPDGHCTDEGYAVMARAVAADAVARLR